MFVTDTHGQTRRIPCPHRLERMSEGVRYVSDVPCIPPAFIASPVTLPVPPWAEPIR